MNLVSFRTTRCPLFPKPVSWLELFFAVSYSKTALGLFYFCKNSKSFHFSRGPCFIGDAFSGFGIVEDLIDIVRADEISECENWAICKNHQYKKKSNILGLFLRYSNGHIKSTLIRNSKENG